MASFQFMTTCSMQSRTEGGEGLGYTTFCYDTKKVSNFSQAPAQLFSHNRKKQKEPGDKVGFFTPEN